MSRKCSKILSKNPKRIAVVVLYPNRHVIDLFEGLKAKGFQVDYYFFAEIPEYRLNNNWQVPDSSTFLSVLSPSTYLKMLGEARSYKAIFFQSLVAPFLVNASLQIAVRCLRGDRFILSEGTRNRSKKRFVTRLIAKSLLNSKTVQHLSIGTGAARDYLDYGFTNWSYRKFCFSESYNSVKGEQWQGCPLDHIVILCVGRLLARKNFSQVIEAIKNYEGLQEVTLAICGNGPEESKLRRLAETLSEKVHVHFAGHCTKEVLDTYYRRADIFALSSTYEGWGVVVNQALHFGLPLILSSNVRSGKDFLLKEGENGLRYSSTDELRQSLISLIEHKERRETMGRISIEHNQLWCRENVVERLEQLIKDRDIQFDDEGPLSEIPML